MFTDESRFSVVPPDGYKKVWRKQGERFVGCTFDPRVSYQEGLIMIWAEISLTAHTELYIVPGGSLAAVQDITKIIQDFVVSCGLFAGDNFLLLHGNARLHTIGITQQYLDEVNIAVME